MTNRSPPRFTVVVALLFVLLASIQLAASLLFYQAIDRRTLQEDHARRVAELLVVSTRLYAVSPERTPGTVSSRYLSAELTNAPQTPQVEKTDVLREIKSEIVTWEPALANRNLRLAFQSQHGGHKDLVGSLRMDDGRWLNFRSKDITAHWPIATRAITITLVSTAAILLLGLAALYWLGKPLRRLTAAAHAIGHGRAVDISEHGPRDLGDLAHAMNTMQTRIARLLTDQAKSFEAISHDLRTPLSRQKIAADLIDDAEIAEIVSGSVNEMEGLLGSLQSYLRAQHLMAEPERIDLVDLAKAVAQQINARTTTPDLPVALTVTRAGQGSTAATTFPEPLRLTLTALAENAVHYGTRAEITVECPAEGRCTITVEDNGPGIDPAYFTEILDPFFRLDEARTRDTAGFGLGIPTANLLMLRFNGELTFGRSDRGGLKAVIGVPVG